MKASLLLLLSALPTISAFAPQTFGGGVAVSSTALRAAPSDDSAAAAASATTTTGGGRRDFVSSIAAFGAAAAVLGVNPNVASASGGATAGKYTTIPIAKRRYYGRVQQAVHEFLLMAPEVIAGDMSASYIQYFFDPEGIVVVQAKKKDVNGQCTKKDGDCRGREIRDSRYNDMKASMYLLGNAFRINQTKAPDNLPTVQAAKAFFKEMDAMEKSVRTKKPKAQDRVAQGHYLAALDILDKYLDLVELPPTNSGHYDKEFDTLVGESARLT
eukprot:CAMPEP_0183291074 /NCGR_PEP_ID=MMETSP0160_2-20130417/624_1 /TAXON_ID=2839 ORGANISM="Odontella Sinensis, Strain Grunow 1884" /NCGR_SAMPLE_ID=MMETSP0160_2 /ASSEMBLY_ACC=CAM_ASM_000250 /LENGTH=270 /DNA_ID=CAMNT_0025451827 /DNA_START=70 /DNA_END=882 /DNA_ORIENTATION=-